MKRCVQCSSELNDNAKFCPKCGEKQDEKFKASFCEKCGENLSDSTKFCPSCGTPIGGRPTSSNTIKTLADKEKLSATFCIMVAGLQAFWFLLMIVVAANVWWWSGVEYFISMLLVAGVSALNFVAGFKSLKFSKEILIQPNGILKRYSNINPFIGAIVYNGILLVINLIDVSILGIIITALAVGVSIYDLIVIRNFVMENQDELRQLETIKPN